MKRPTYAAACKWIAANDETSETDASAMKDLISVALVADLFGVPDYKVADDVIEWRRAIWPRSMGA